jgi:hypothetical protein
MFWRPTMQPEERRAVTQALPPLELMVALRLLMRLLDGG